MSDLMQAYSDMLDEVVNGDERIVPTQTPVMGSVVSAQECRESLGLAKSESVDHPVHYGNGADDPYEAIKVIDAWNLGFATGNAAKYICRAGKKPGADAVEDLRKSVWYLQHEIERLTKGK